MRLPSLVSAIVFVLGLVAAAASGVQTYRALGVYGGAMFTGFQREWDPVTRQARLVHETTTQTGIKLRRQLSNCVGPGNCMELQKLTLVSPRDLASELAKAPGVGTTVDERGRTGFSTAKDAVIDAWVTSDSSTGRSRIEVSTKRNGTIDRWEHYDKGQLVRVELDTNGNGKADRWMTYEAGILMETFTDSNEDGQPDQAPPPVR